MDDLALSSLSVSGDRVAVLYGVFDTQQRGVEIEHFGEECCAPLHVVPAFGPFVQPAHSGQGQVRAWGVGDHQVPWLAQQFEDVALYVGSGGRMSQLMASWPARRHASRTMPLVSHAMRIM